jgi:hypothetical protein
MGSFLREVVMVDILSLIQTYGPEIALIGFFVWQTWKREQRTDRRINKLEDADKQVLLPMLENATAVIARNTVIMERLENLLRSLEISTGRQWNE